MKAAPLGLVVVVVVLATATHAAARSACTAGTHTIGGVKYVTYCGPASAKVKVGGKTYFFKGGACTHGRGYWAIEIGTKTIGDHKPKFDWFGITLVGKRAGIYHRQSASWTFKTGRLDVLSPATVKVALGWKRGTFSGTRWNGHGTGSGSFSCG